MSALSVYCVFSPRRKEEANAAGRNYWYVYTAEILSRLGVVPQVLSTDDCANLSALEHAGVLLVGDLAEDDLPPRALGTLTQWVADGGVLIGFAPEGLDTLFGVKADGVVPQANGPFSINGYFELAPSPVTEDCRAPMVPEQRLIIVSPLRPVEPSDSAELARLFLCDEAARDDGARARDAGAAAITHRALESGHAFYFAFNVPQTMWTIQQGRPIDRDYDGDNWLRFSDACILGKNSLAVPYTDALHFLLGNMLGRIPLPMIHAVPPRDGKVAPALLSFGGDDECTPGIQAPASDFMAAQGLPYHINAMPSKGKFALGPEEQAHIEANGHELALHYNFMEGFNHPCGFTRDDVLGQARLFREAFGRDSVCTVAHCCRWTGWAEPAHWMLEAGGRGDNSRVHWTSPPANPVNRLGFAFGSPLPRYFWDDAAHGNERVPLLQIPMAAYEVGYEGEKTDLATLRRAFDYAVRYRLVFNFFYHPVYLAKYPACRAAIEELVRWMAALPVPPVLKGPDAVTLWWEARSAAVIENAGVDGDGVFFDAECDYPDGFVVKVPTGDAPPIACLVDGQAADVATAREFGQHWAGRTR